MTQNRPSQRQHGTRTRYVHGAGPGQGKGCRCAPCREANRAYVERVTREKLYGRWHVWAAEELVTSTAEHLRALGSAGVGYKAAARAAGVDVKCAWEIRSGRRTRVREETARKLLRVTTAARSPHALVDAGETWRLLGELIATGMTKRRIARCLGFGDSLQLRKDRGFERSARAVKELHDGLWPIWPALRAVCSCYAAVQFEERRELNKAAKRRQREAVAS